MASTQVVFRDIQNENEVVLVEKLSDKSNDKNKKSTVFTETETRLLISEWFKYPQLYDKKAPEYQDRDKRAIALENIANSFNDSDEPFTYSDWW